MDTVQLTILERIAICVCLSCDQDGRGEQAQGGTKSKSHDGDVFRVSRYAIEGPNDTKE